MQWRLHAWCLMGNHYHPLHSNAPNLVEGMKWLQNTFANKLIAYVKPMDMYSKADTKPSFWMRRHRCGLSLHSKPVRAGIVQPADLHSYRDSGFYQLCTRASAGHLR